MNTVWMKGKAGLGCRLAGLMSGIRYAERNGRAIYVDWRDKVYSDGKENLFDRVFELRGLPVWRGSPPIDGNRIFPKTWIGSLDRDVRDREKSYKENEMTFDFRNDSLEEEILVGWSYTLDYEGEDRTKEMRRLWKERLFFKEAFQRSLAGFQKENGLEDACAVHVRWGQDLAVFKGNPRVSYDAYAKAFESSGAKRMLLCTDVAEVEERMRGDYGDRVVVWKKGWFPPTDQRDIPVHLRGMHQNPACPDRKQVFMESCVDFWLMSGCRWLVWDGMSSFSLMAFNCGNRIPESIVAHD